MCCCQNTRVLQLGAVSPFTFNVSGGTGPIPGGPVTSGPITIGDGDTLHLWSVGSINVQVIPGSVNVELTTNNIIDGVGAPVAPPADVNVTNFYVDTSTDIVYYWDGAAWVPTTASADITNQTFVSNVNWDFSNNDWTVTNVDEWDVTTNDIQFNTNTFEVTSTTVNFTASVFCLPGITQNDALNRFLVQDLSGCLSWRDGSTITATVNNPTFVTDQTWNFTNNDWTITNVDNFAITSNTFTVNSPVVCFPDITQNDTLTRFLVQDVGGCISWRAESSLPSGGINGLNIQDEGVTVGTSNGITNINFVGAGVVATGVGANATITISGGGGGGGMTSFDITDGSTTQTVDDSEIITFADSTLVNAVVSATNTVTHSIAPGSNGQIMYTNAGVAAWAFTQDILDTLSFTNNVTWNFNANDWTVTNVNDWTVTADTITFNSPVVCLTGLTQNDALTRFLVMDVGGCISWRDEASLPSGGGGLVSANNGLSVSGSTVQLGSAAPGGAPLLFNTSIDMAGFGISFRAQSVGMVGAPSGQSGNLTIGNIYGQVISGNAYDFENVFPNADFIGSDVGFAVWNSTGTMKRVNHDQMPYHVRTLNSDTTLTSRDSTVEVDTTAGDVTITLNSGINFYNGAVAGDGQGKKFKIKKSAGTNDVIVQVSGGGTIDGFSSLIITNLNDSVELQADSTTSYIAIGSHAASGTNYIGGGNFNGLGGHIPDLALFNTVSLSANQNNWNPAGLSTAIGYIVSLPSGNVNITGITNPSVHRLLWIFNNSTNHIRLMNQDGASTAANRIKCPDSANFEIKDNALTQVLYVPLLNRWIVVNEVKD